MQDVVEKVQLFVKCEGFVIILDVIWDDVGLLCDVCEDFEFFICRVIKFFEEYQVFK